MTRVANDILQGLQEALAHARGDLPDGLVEHKVNMDDVDAKTIRKSLNLTQEQMANLLGTSVSGYRKWEHGERRPGGAARTLMKVMSEEPEAVLRALSR